jgi:hypothetical protein
MEPSKDGPCHVHSNYAKLIVNSLIVARFYKKAEKAHFRIESSEEISKDVKNFKFVDIDCSCLVDHLFDREIEDIGKHYVVCHD